MHTFVTGGTGHSGPYIIAELLAAGHEVTALVRSDAAATRHRPDAMPFCLIGRERR